MAESKAVAVRNDLGVEGTAEGSEELLRVMKMLSTLKAMAVTQM